MAEKTHRCNKEAEISQILTELKLLRELHATQSENQKNELKYLKDKQDDMYKRLFDKDGLISEHEQVKGALKVTQIIGSFILFCLTIYVTIKDKIKGAP